MQAINHVATALVLKRAAPSAPLLGLIVATEAVEYLWVGLNVAGIERTVIDAGMRSVADIHLAHMPFSHSIATSLALAALVGLVWIWRGRRASAGVALAMAMAVLSHIVLDLFVHAPDIALMPWTEGTKYGTGLYATLPLPALLIETCWGVACWWIFRGSWGLLAVILGLGVAAVPTYSVTVNVGESLLSGQSAVFAVIILAQMVVTSLLVWRFARDRKPRRRAPLSAEEIARAVADARHRARTLWMRPS